MLAKLEFASATFAHGGYMGIRYMTSGTRAEITKENSAGFKLFIFSLFLNTVERFV